MQGPLYRLGSDCCTTSGRLQRKEMCKCVSFAYPCAGKNKSLSPWRHRFTMYILRKNNHKITYIVLHLLGLKCTPKRIGARGPPVQFGRWNSVVPFFLPIPTQTECPALGSTWFQTCRHCPLQLKRLPAVQAIDQIDRTQCVSSLHWSLVSAGETAAWQVWW